MQWFFGVLLPSFQQAGIQLASDSLPQLALPRQADGDVCLSQFFRGVFDEIGSRNRPRLRMPAGNCGRARMPCGHSAIHIGYILPETPIHWRILTVHTEQPSSDAAAILPRCHCKRGSSGAGSFQRYRRVVRYEGGGIGNRGGKFHLPHIGSSSTDLFPLNIHTPLCQAGTWQPISTSCTLNDPLCLAGTWQPISCTYTINDPLCQAGTWQPINRAAICTVMTRGRFPSFHIARFHVFTLSRFHASTFHASLCSATVVPL